MSLTILHHAEILQDTVRNSAYEQAISDMVQPGHTVVDIGSGFGLLSAYCRSRTSKKIWAIEYFDEVAVVAKQVLADLDIKLINKSSYEVELGTSPDVLVTETIGAVGPEENIVELVFDFCTRHPGVNIFVPNRLAIYAQPVKTQKGSELLRELIAQILTPNSEIFPLGTSLELLKQLYSGSIHQADLTGCISVGPVRQIASYDLGVTEGSDFVSELLFPDDLEFDCLNIYFEATLSPGVTLTNNPLSSRTHWLHSFVLRPESKHRAMIAYSSDTRSFLVQWD